MKAIASILFSVFLLKITQICLADFDSAGPIQIVIPRNHQTYELEIDELKHILEADSIKDRHIVVVSIAGASRQGKSFLLNFFLKFLYAQVSIHYYNDKNVNKNRLDCKMRSFLFKTTTTTKKNSMNDTM